MRCQATNKHNLNTPIPSLFFQAKLPETRMCAPGFLKSECIMPQTQALSTQRKKHVNKMEQHSDILNRRSRRRLLDVEDLAVKPPENLSTSSMRALNASAGAERPSTPTCRYRQTSKNMSGTVSNICICAEANNTVYIAALR